MNGFQIIEDHNLVLKTQIRFPRSKKKRIRNKWSARKENWKITPDPTYYHWGNQIVCHPVMAEKLRNHEKH
jgi:hypothetical protein